MTFYTKTLLNFYTICNPPILATVYKIYLRRKDNEDAGHRSPYISHAK